VQGGGVAGHDIKLICAIVAISDIPRPKRAPKYILENRFLSFINGTHLPYDQSNRKIKIRLKQYINILDEVNSGLLRLLTLHYLLKYI
jgi:hypothetical protein